MQLKKKKKGCDLKKMYLVLFLISVVFMLVVSWSNQKY